MKLFMLRESSLSETPLAIAFVASAFAMSALADSIFFCISFTLAVRSAVDAVVAVAAAVVADVAVVVDSVAVEMFVRYTRYIPHCLKWLDGL